ncbi:hypothetical protein [Streptomyces sp. NPDC058657]|uniref:hypothetical protein n=1 Tax=unclassified Streptomyces TaxID=2593676 RepID=UPI00364699B0
MVHPAGPQPPALRVLALPLLLWRIVRRYARILGESLPEAQAVFIERTAEQTLRVAACLAASECSETITDEILFAAFTLVRRSVQDAVRITKGADSPKVKRQSLSLADKVRARIELHGGRANSTQMLPYVGASAREVKALPGIVVTVERSGKTGRPSTVFTLEESTPVPAERETQAQSSSHYGEPQPASTEREGNRGSVVQMNAYRAVPVQAATPAPEPSPQTASVAQANPFRSLL